MNKEIFKKLILQSEPRQRLILAGLILVLLVIFLFGSMLAPYYAHFNSLRGELASMRILLATKIKRAKNLTGLDSEYRQLQKDLLEIDKHYYTDEEAEEFMKQLPKIVAGFGGRVVTLAPRKRGDELSRVDKLKQYITELDLVTEKELNRFLEDNKNEIDQPTEPEKALFVTALRLVPEKNKAQFKTLWQQPPSSDLFSRLKLRKLDLEAVIEGRHSGLISLLSFFDKSDKLIGFDRLSVSVIGEKAPEVEAKFILTLYVVK
ncbi:MAG: hypothetical protein ABIH69_05055 [bacterium]